MELPDFFHFFMFEFLDVSQKDVSQVSVEFYIGFCNTHICFHSLFLLGLQLPFCDNFEHGKVEVIFL